MGNTWIQVGDYLWSQSWQIALIAAGVAVVNVALRDRSAHPRYLLWLLVVAKCLVPPLLGVAVPILPQAGPAVSPVPMEQLGSIAGELAAAQEDSVAIALATPDPAADSYGADRRIPVVSGREAIAILWLGGLAVFLGAAAVKAWRVTRWLAAERNELPESLRDNIRDLLRSLGAPRTTTVWLMPDGSQPFVWGLWRGDIYLPATFASPNHLAYQRDILAHELSHVLRFDAAVNLLQIVAQAIFWFHPLVWWANVKIRREREKCCDEMAIARLGAQPRSYSRAIVEALRVEHQSKGLVPSLAIAGAARNIEERIKTMLRPGKKFHRRPSLGAAVCALAMALLIVPTTLAFTRAADKTPTAGELKQQRTASAEKLKNFALRLNKYADEHQGTYPKSDEISWASEKDPGDFDVFLLEKVQYLGADKMRPQTGVAAMPLAFDIPLLKVAGGTNVLFADGHVEFIATDKLAARGVAIPKVSLEVTAVRFEPIHQGTNVVHVTTRNTSSAEQLFAAHVYTRSPDYGVPGPDPDQSGVGWGTGGYFNALKPGETKLLRLAFKIHGPVTDRTYVNLRVSNPETKGTYDGKWYFYDRKYMSAELPKAPAAGTKSQASPSDAQAVTQAFTDIQRDLQDRQYEKAWERFSRDYQVAEYQRDGLEAFRRAMEPTHRLHSAFTWERANFLKLKPGQVSGRQGSLSLAAGFEGQTWTIDFVRENNQLKIDQIVGYVPAVLRMQEENAQEQTAKPGNLKVLDVQFDPVQQGKNAVRINVQNTSETDQTLGVDIRTEGPIRNWQRQFTEAMKAGQTKQMTFNFEFLGPIADVSSVRLRFSNPAPGAQVDADDYFEQRRYTRDDLPLSDEARKGAEPVSQAEKDTVTKAFADFQEAIKGQNYQAAWDLSSEHFHSMFGGDIERFKGQMSSEGAKQLFLALQPGSVTRLGTWLTLDTAGEYEAMRIHFIQQDGRWKLYQGEMNTTNWEDRILPKMEKRNTAHFDIYYPKDSTAAREIDRIAKQKDAGFDQICKFVGKDSDVRIRMVFFQDGATKQRATGHQGAGWAYDQTIVEIYNDQEKLAPYHETAHILMGPVGHPPALFNEGFAVYISETLGGHALESLGGDQATIDQRVKELKSKGDWIELPQLLTFTEIGSAESRPPVAYAQAASFVKFMIDTYGKDKFLQAYRTLQNSNNKTVQEQNIKKLEQICGKPLPTLQQQWEAAFTHS